MQTLHDGCNFVEVGEVDRHVGADRQPDAVGSQRNVANEIKNRGVNGFVATDAMVNSNFKDIEMIEILPRPIANSGAIADADRRDLRVSCRFAQHGYPIRSEELLACQK